MPAAPTRTWPISPPPHRPAPPPRSVQPPQLATSGRFPFHPRAGQPPSPKSRIGSIRGSSRSTQASTTRTQSARKRATGRPPRPMANPKGARPPAPPARLSSASLGQRAHCFPSPQSPAPPGPSAGRASPVRKATLPPARCVRSWRGALDGVPWVPSPAAQQGRRMGAGPSPSTPVPHPPTEATTPRGVHAGRPIGLIPGGMPPDDPPLLGTSLCF